MSESQQRRVHRAALAVSVATFPLIWLGGLVTTHDAGMAVPDWPGTYGYNLFLYPWTAWLYGPFDLFVEHGHRLLASLVGLLAIWLCWVSFRNEPRAWLRRAAYLLLFAIIAQGILGGVRVLFDARTIAMIHGCSGPLVFALAAFITFASSKSWHQVTPYPLGRWLPRIAILLVISSILQLFLGAQLRHVQPTVSTVFFMSTVHLHLTVAVLITLLIAWLTILVRRPAYRQATGIRLPANSLSIILIVQVLLGCATWVSNYALPWQELNSWLAAYAINGKGFWESMIVTGHQATGSLIIVLSVWLACRIMRANSKVTISQFNTTEQKKSDASAVSGAVPITAVTGSPN